MAAADKDVDILMTGNPNNKVNETTNEKKIEMTICEWIDGIDENAKGLNEFKDALIGDTNGEFSKNHKMQALCELNKDEIKQILGEKTLQVKGCMALLSLLMNDLEWYQHRKQSNSM